MIGALKTIGTVITVASSAQFGKDMYDKYKTKKKNVKLDEVHKFIGSLDLESLQEAIKSKDEDKLINAVEAIIDAADAVKHKSDFEEITEDVQDAAGYLFDKVSDFGSQVVKTVGDKIDDLTSTNEDVSKPTFKEFRKNGKKLIVNVDGEDCSVCIEDNNVYVNKKNKSITFVKDGKAITTTLE